MTDQQETASSVDVEAIKVRLNAKYGPMTDYPGEQFVESSSYRRDISALLDALERSEQTVAELRAERDRALADVLEGAEHDCELMNGQSAEIAELRAEGEQLRTYLATANRQLDRVDEVLPRWEGTGRGRIDTIQELMKLSARAQRGQA